MIINISLTKKEDFMSLQGRDIISAIVHGTTLLGKWLVILEPGFAGGMPGVPKVLLRSLDEKDNDGFDFFVHFFEGKWVKDDRSVIFESSDDPSITVERKEEDNDSLAGDFHTEHDAFS
jgi:hypothetical protein